MHYFSDKNDLDELLVAFNVQYVRKDEGCWDNNGETQFYSNWQVLVDKPA